MSKPISMAKFSEGSRGLLGAIVCHKLTGDTMFFDDRLQVSNNCRRLGVGKLFHQRKLAVIISH